MDGTLYSAAGTDDIDVMRVSYGADGTVGIEWNMPDGSPFTLQARQTEDGRDLVELLAQAKASVMSRFGETRRDERRRRD